MKIEGIMLDLETLGKHAGCAILSIGAVHFADGQIKDDFYVRVDLQSCLDVGLEIDADTLCWWVEQNTTALHEAFAAGPDRMPLDEALDNFATFYNNAAGIECIDVYGDGAAFDQPIIQAAYNACEMDIPWGHKHNKCYRTIRGLFNSEKPKSMLEHHACEDATNQARHLMEIVKEL